MTKRDLQRHRLRVLVLSCVLLCSLVFSCLLAPAQPTPHILPHNGRREFKVEFLKKVCVHCQKVLWLLSEADLTFQTHMINLVEKPKWFLDLAENEETPLANVDGKWINESVDIMRGGLAWLCARGGEKQERSDERSRLPLSSSQADQRLSRICSVLRCPVVVRGEERSETGALVCRRRVPLLSDLPNLALICSLFFLSHTTHGPPLSLPLPVFPSIPTLPPPPPRNPTNQTTAALKNTFPEVEEILSNDSTGGLAGLQIGEVLRRAMLTVRRFEPDSKELERIVKELDSVFEQLSEQLLFDGPFISGSEIGFSDL